MRFGVAVTCVIAAAATSPAVGDGGAYIGTSGSTSTSPVVPLVTGCGRSGTHTAGELLLSLGIEAVHEGAKEDAVSVSWSVGGSSESGASTGVKTIEEVSISAGVH